MNRDALTLFFFDAVPAVKTVIETKRLLFPPAEEGEEIGRAVFCDENGRELGSVPLRASEAVPAPVREPGLFDKLFGPA